MQLKRKNYVWPKNLTLNLLFSDKAGPNAAKLFYGRDVQFFIIC